jgi:hypothetical protein
MADIFDEVGEDLRRERLKRLWQGYGIYFIAAAVLVVLATAGWRAYESWQADRAATAGDGFRAALAMADEGDHDAAAEALQAFSLNAPANYALLARFRAATERAAAGNAEAALGMFEAIAGDSRAPQPIRDLATIRAAMVAVDREDLGQIRARVARLDTAGNAFRHAAREIVAVSALRAEAWGEARAALATLTGDAELPPDFAQRARVMEDVVRAAIGAADDEPEAAS